MQLQRHHNRLNAASVDDCSSDRTITSKIGKRATRMQSHIPQRCVLSKRSDHDGAAASSVNLWAVCSASRQLTQGFASHQCNRTIGSMCAQCREKWLGACGRDCLPVGAVCGQHAKDEAGTMRHVS